MAGVNLSLLNPRFYFNLKPLLRALQEAGLVFSIEDGFRPFSVQAAAYASGKKRVAKPEESYHPKGRAVDLKFAQKDIPQALALIRSAGFYALDESSDYPGIVHIDDRFDPWYLKSALKKSTKKEIETALIGLLIIGGLYAVSGIGKSDSNRNQRAGSAFA